jgi:TatA/E family protein of Tat protein translocase
MPFNIGYGELILLAAVALLLFGPRRLPEIGKAIGEGMASFKKAVSSATEAPLPPHREQAPTPASGSVADPPRQEESIP